MPKDGTKRPVEVQRDDRGDNPTAKRPTLDEIRRRLDVLPRERAACRPVMRSG